MTRAPFIPAWLDDLGLTPQQFRLLAHVWRRGRCHASAGSMAAACRLKRDTVFSGLAELERRGLIRRTPRQGQTTIIEPVPPNGTGDAATRPPKRDETRPLKRDTTRPPKRGTKVSPLKVSPMKESTLVVQHASVGGRRGTINRIIQPKQSKPKR